MSFQPFDRNPSGIVFFGTSASDKLYESVSTFTYDAAQNSLRIPNGGYIGTQGDFDSISIASNGNVTLSQSLSVAGNLTVNGTTTTVNSTVVTVEDPVIILGADSANAATYGGTQIDDNKDRGIAFTWNDGGTKPQIGFFGHDDSIGGFTYITSGTFDAASGYFTASQLGWAKFQGVSGALAGNATTATTLQTARNFSVTGNMTAQAVSFDGSAPVVLTGVMHPTAISDRTEITSVEGTLDYLLIWDATDSGLKRVNRSNFVSGLGSMSSFLISDGTNPTQQIDDGNTLLFRSGAAISFTVSATDSVSGTLNSSVAGLGLSMTNQVLAIDLSEYVTPVALASGDSFLLLDSDGSTEQRSTVTQLGQFMAGNGLIDNGGGVLAVGAGNGISVAADSISVTAGTGISVDSNGIHIDLSEYVTPVAFASGDSFLVLDSDGATEQRGTITQLGAFMAGTNVTAGGDGKLSVTDATIEGVVFTAANFVDSSRIDFTATAGQSVTADLIANSVSETYLTTSVAGLGLAGGNGTALTIDLSEYVTPAAVASGDSFLMLDSDGSTEQRSTVTQLGAYFAGTNVTAGGDGKLSVTDATIEGVVFTSANFVDGTTIDFTATAGQSVTAEVKTNSISETYLTTSVAGLGLAGGNGTALTIDLNEYSSVAIASGDRLFTLDSDNTTEQLTTVVQLAQFMAGNGLGDTGAGALAVNVDNSTLEISSDSLRIKDSGVTEVKRSRTTAAVSTSVTLSNDINLCTAGAGGITVTLPAVITGKMVRVKKVDSAAGTVTVQRGGSSTIDGATTVVLYHQWEALNLVSDGTNWYIV